MCLSIEIHLDSYVISAGIRLGEHDHAMFVYTSACGRPWSFCHFFQGLDRSPGFLWYFGESKSCGYHIMVSCPVLIDRTLVSFIPLLANVEGAEWIVERHFPM